MPKLITCFAPTIFTLLAKKNKSVSPPHETHSVITSVSDDSAMYNYGQQLIIYMKHDINEK